MSEMPIFPIGLYWIRTEVDPIDRRDATYATLWIFPSGNFRYIDCWPGYSWFEASGAWRYGLGLIHCRGKSHSFTDSFYDNHDNRPYTSAFSADEDGQTIVSVGLTPRHYARLSLQHPGPLFALDELTVPTRWRDFRKLMREIERASGLEQNGAKCTSSISICNGNRGVTI